MSRIEPGDRFSTDPPAPRTVHEDVLIVPRLAGRSGKRRVIAHGGALVYDHFLDLASKARRERDGISKLEEILPDSFFQRLLPQREKGAIDVGEAAVEIENVGEIGSVRKGNVEGPPLLPQMGLDLLSSVDQVIEKSVAFVRLKNGAVQDELNRAVRAAHGLMNNRPMAIGLVMKQIVTLERDAVLLPRIDHAGERCAQWNRGIRETVGQIPAGYVVAKLVCGGREGVAYIEDLIRRLVRRQCQEQTGQRVERHAEIHRRLSGRRSCWRRHDLWPLCLHTRTGSRIPANYAHRAIEGNTMCTRENANEQLRCLAAPSWAAAAVS